MSASGRLAIGVFVGGLAIAGEAFGASTINFPGGWGDWETREPDQVGMMAGLLEEAVRFAQENETTRPRDLGAMLPMSIGNEPFDEIVGPTKERGGMCGLIVKNGFIVAEWGDTFRVDMTFSVTKTYLSTVAGLAYDRRLIRSVNDPVRPYVQDGGFESEHNAKITWHMMLNQTNEWEGTLWGKPDWADRWNGEMRVLQEPGTHWQYNDVRVNRLALALLQVWRRPLPQVLKEHIMDPIGASPTWRWHGYDNSWVTIDGVKMQSVSGGGHWGGGMFISARDHARFGLLFLENGNWNGKQLISRKWIDLARTPTPVKRDYGYMNWYLNTDRERYPSAPESTVTFLGSGTNMIWMDREHGILSVVRWIDGTAVDGYMKHVLAAVKE